MAKELNVLNDEERDAYWRLYADLEYNHWAWIACLFRVPYPIGKEEKMKLLDKMFNIDIG